MLEQFDKTQQLLGDDFPNKSNVKKAEVNFGEPVTEAQANQSRRRMASKAPAMIVSMGTYDEIIRTRLGKRRMAAKESTMHASQDGSTVRVATAMVDLVVPASRSASAAKWNVVSATPVSKIPLSPNRARKSKRRGPGTGPGRGSRRATRVFRIVLCL